MLGCLLGLLQVGCPRIAGDELPGDAMALGGAEQGLPLRAVLDRALRSEGLL